ncbi:DUF4412 domain-containing protein [Aureibaculum sp. A20]|uniref:DUF4412 domain-containing protein n=1 Tax=Aureibaculum flavum TaxID=2795986 RepID=A0ABS0WPB6_9FLAO|nr:DUF4412 domain-containing protein [Aureibaculum flavum]MBJ2173834.1 DUF4412 domain-containing protein [Aureibaculum flavum]
MKKFILVALLSLSVSVFAQKEIKEGVMTTKVTMSSDNEQVNASFAMIGDIGATTHFKGNKARTEQTNQMTGTQTSIVDQEAEKMLMLMDVPMMGKKYMKQDTKKSEEELKDVSVTANGESKTVAGYDCKGYDVVSKVNGQEIKMKMFVTDKILAQEQYTAMLGGKLKGFPLHMVISMNQGGMAMDITMEVTEVKAESVPDSKFDMTVPEGYTEMAMPKQ